MIIGGGNDLMLNTALAQVGSGTGALYIGPGLYLLQQPVSITNSNTRVICDASARFIAQSNFPTPNMPMIQILGGNNIDWIGGTFDGNGIGGRGIQINTGTTNVNIERVTVTGVTQYSIFGALRASGTLSLYKCAFGTSAQPAIFDYCPDGNTAVLRVRDCEFTNISNFAVGSSSVNANGVAHFEASGNLFTNCGLLSGGIISSPLYGFQVTYGNWHDNVFIKCKGACHADTFGSVSMRNNVATGSTQNPDFFAEITPYSNISGNISRNNSGERGIIVGQGGSGGASGLIMGCVCRDNKVINCQGGIGFGGVSQGVLEANYVENPTNGIAYQVANSATVRFAFNQSIFSSGGTHLNADAIGSACSVNVYGDQTNAATAYSQTNGGTITTKVS